MQYFKVIFLSFIFLFLNPAYSQVADHPVIAEIYGGGGNTGSYYKYDYIILYNPTAQNIDISNWSVQYASATSASWSATNLEGIIYPGAYYIIQQKGGTKGGEELPSVPNVVGSISLATTSGKVALVSAQTELTLNNPTADGNVVDFVGYGSADAFEGTGAAPSPSNTESIRRLDNSGGQTMGTAGSGYDTDDNAADFFAAPADAENPPLPVELSSFNVLTEGSKILLKWETATEVNNYGFEVQRRDPPLRFPSREGNFEWLKIGFVKGAGNSNNLKQYKYTDNSIIAGEEYLYRLKQIDNDGNYKFSREVSASAILPGNCELFQNYPNPFNPVTIIKYNISEQSRVELKIYNILGKEIRSLVNEVQQAGSYSIEFNGSGLGSGVYFYRIAIYPQSGEFSSDRLKAGNFTVTKMMSLIK